MTTASASLTKLHQPDFEHEEIMLIRPSSHSTVQGGDQLVLHFTSDKIEVARYLSDGTRVIVDIESAGLEPETILEEEYFGLPSNSDAPVTSLLELPSICEFLREKPPMRGVTEDRFNAVFAMHDSDERAFVPCVRSCAIDGDEYCLIAMHMFGSILGRLLRNLARNNPPTGGIFLTGEIMQNGVAHYVIEHDSFEYMFGNPDIPIYFVKSDSYSYTNGMPRYLKHA